MNKFSLLMACLVIAGLAGCASVDSARSIDLLTAAGFEAKTPKTDVQKEVYDEIDSHQMLTGVVNGQRLFGYKDKAKGVVYVGNQAQYQKLKRLAAQENVRDASLTAVEMDPVAVKRYRTLVPYGYMR